MKISMEGELGPLGKWTKAGEDTDGVTPYSAKHTADGMLMISYIIFILRRWKTCFTILCVHVSICVWVGVCTSLYMLVHVKVRVNSDGLIALHLIT